MTAIGFIGAGQMATALAKAWHAAGLLDAARSLASDPVPSSREAFTGSTGIRTTASNPEVATHAELLVLAVKPQMMAGVLTEIKPAMNPKTFVFSIAAGITLKTLEAGLGAVPLVRVMPNTPCLVRQSASAYAANVAVSNEQLVMVKKLLESVGLAVMLPEKLLDAVTGLSGSGPAYVFLIIEALADGGVKMGLPRDVALKMAAQTVRGAATMVLETGTHPAMLRDAVTSPAGTTIAGLHELELAGVRAALINAVESATNRATELGQS